MSNLKFEKFLNRIQEVIQSNTEEVFVDLNTVKFIILIFEEELSEKQRIKWKTKLAMIKSYKSVESIK